MEYWQQKRQGILREFQVVYSCSLLWFKLWFRFFIYFPFYLDNLIAHYLILKKKLGFIVSELTVGSDDQNQKNKSTYQSIIKNFFMCRDYQPSDGLGSHSLILQKIQDSQFRNQLLDSVIKMKVIVHIKLFFIRCKDHQPAI